MLHLQPREPPGASGRKKGERFVDCGPPIAKAEPLKITCLPRPQAFATLTLVSTLRFLLAPRPDYHAAHPALRSLPSNTPPYPWYRSQVDGFPNSSSSLTTLQTANPPPWLQTAGLPAAPFESAPACLDLNSDSYPAASYFGEGRGFSVNDRDVIKRCQLAASRAYKKAGGEQTFETPPRGQGFL